MAVGDLYLFLKVSWVGLQRVIVAFPGHIHLLLVIFFYFFQPFTE